MNIKVVCSYKTKFPRDLGKIVNTIISAVPPKYILGLHSIILVDRIVQSVAKDAVGIYLPKTRGEMPHIQIAVATVFEDIPRITFFLPLVTKLLLSSVIFHEIGHHYHTLIRTPVKKISEQRTEDFSTFMLRATFPRLRSILFLFSKIRRLFSKTEKKKGNGRSLRSDANNPDIFVEEDDLYNHIDNEDD